MCAKSAVIVVVGVFVPTIFDYAKVFDIIPLIRSSPHRKINRK